MAIISPFKGILYDTDRVDPSSVITQPYDKISPEAREDYRKASPYNIVRIIKGKPMPEDNETENVYTRAAGYFQQWLKESVLLRQESPAYYYLEQKYRVEGQERVRKGLICMGRLEDYSAGVIFPHEQTLKGPKKDRLELFRATKASFGQIFLLYNDREKRVDSAIAQTRGAPYLSFTDPEGVNHALHVVDNPQTIRQVTEMMRDKRLFIADGHHRYETALAFKKEMREKYPDAGEDAAFNYCMMTLVNMDDEGMTVFPTHRLVKNVPDFDSSKLLEQMQPFFSVEELPYQSGDIQLLADRCLETLNEQTSSAFVALFSDSKKPFLIKPKDVDDVPGLEGHPPVAKTLDVAILHDGILAPYLGIDEAALAEQRNLDYRRSARNCLEMTLNGDYQAVFLLRPTRVEQVRDMALNRETMPQKSTDFYPKVLTGFVMADVSEGQSLSFGKEHERQMISV